MSPGVAYVTLSGVEGFLQIKFLLLSQNDTAILKMRIVNRGVYYLLLILNSLQIPAHFGTILESNRNVIIKKYQEEKS
jgi:hypothetical protein